MNFLLQDGCMTTDLRILAELRSWTGARLPTYRRGPFTLTPPSSPS